MMVFTGTCFGHADSQIPQACRQYKPPQHLGNGKDYLAVRRIKYEFFLHPFPPFLTAFSMTGGAEAASLAGKHQ